MRRYHATRCLRLQRPVLATLCRLFASAERWYRRTRPLSTGTPGSAPASRRQGALRRAYGVLSPDDADLGALASEQVLTLARIPEPRLLVGQDMKAAFHRLVFHLLDHRFPGHPDFDPNGTGRELRPAELDTVADAVELAARDKVGRLEVPRGDVATLKKIANPLKLGVMHEQAFVLLHEWPDLIDRRATGLPQVTVAQIRRWINDEQRGLPAVVQNLVIVCYSIQANKEWLRGERPVPAPAKVEAVTDDLALRSQELPAEAEFDEASRRAHGIFRVLREPVRSARSVQATAQALRDEAGKLRPAAESLQDELDQHAATLGLTEDSPRMATSRIVTTLLAQLAAADGATQTLRVLVGAELGKDNAIYAAHLAAAHELAATLRGLTWQFLDDFAAGDDDLDAGAVLAGLRQAARRDELEVALAGPLRDAERAALELVRTRTRKPPRLDRQPGQEPDPRLDHATGPQPAADPGPRRLGSAAVHRVRARDVPALAEAICEAADANPEAEFEISWRIVT